MVAMEATLTSYYGVEVLSYGLKLNYAKENKVEYARLTNEVQRSNAAQNKVLARQGSNFNQ